MADDSKKPYGDVTYADPGYKEDGKKRYPLDSEAHCRAAWSYINMPKNHAGYTAEQVAAIKGRIKAALKRYGAEISEERSADFGQMADIAVGGLKETLLPPGDEAVGVEMRPAGPVEYRNAAVGEVNFSQRTIMAIAVPYEQTAPVMYRGSVWGEIFERGSCDGIEKRPNRVRCNRNHDRRYTVGKAVHFWPRREEGLIAEMRMAQTPLGDETLALAADECLSLSVGYLPMEGGERLDVRNKLRHITKAYIDHLAFVESPAYAGAEVLSVRNDDPYAGQAAGADIPALLTPNMEEFANDDILRWASQRLNRQ